MSERDDNRDNERDNEKSSKENESGADDNDDDSKESEPQHIDDSDSDSSGGDSGGDSNDSDDDDDDDESERSDATIIKVAIRHLKRFIEDDEDSNHLADPLVQLLQQYPNAIVQGYFDNYQTYALHDACERKNAPLALIRAIDQAWPDAIKTRDYNSDDNRLPLDCALRNKSVAVEVIEFLLQQYPESVQLRCSDYDKEVALHHACQNGVSLPVIELLIRQWPKALHIKASMGTPLHYAYNHTHVTVSVETLACLIAAWPGALQVRHQDGDIPLHMACRYFPEHEEAMALMIHQCPESVQVTTHREEKRVALHLVCEKSKVSLQTLQLLIRTWPDALRCKDTAGFLPLHLACQQQMPTAVRPGDESDPCLSYSVW